MPTLVTFRGGAVQIAPVFERGAAGGRRDGCEQEQQFHGAMQTNARTPVNASRRIARRKKRLRSDDPSGKFPLRQGLWTADGRTPPGQECSNGSLILFAVVLWRTFSHPTARQMQVLRV